MADVFISYARSDRQKAQTIAEVLEQQEYSVWWDPKIPPGATFAAVIEEEVSSAKCVVVLWSKESVKSEWVQTEAYEGKQRNILVPLLIEDVNIPLEFRRIQAADLRDWQPHNPHADFNLMLDAIANIVGRHPGNEPDQAIREERSRPESEIPKRKGFPTIRVLVGIGLFSIAGLLWMILQKPVSHEYYAHYEREAINVTIKADPKLNFSRGEYHTLKLCIYQLNDPIAFSQFMEYKDGLHKLLECNLIDPTVTYFERVFIQPGKEKNVSLDRAEGSIYIGIAAGYYMLQKERTARLLEIPMKVSHKGFMWLNKYAVLAPFNLDIYLGPQKIERIDVH